MLFNLTYGCFSLLIEVPKDSRERHNDIFKKIPFPPIPFHISNEDIWNLTELNVPPGMYHSIVLQFDGIKPVAISNITERKTE